MGTRLPKQVMLSPPPGRPNTVPSPFQPFLGPRIATGMDEFYFDMARKPHKPCRRGAKPDFKRPDPQADILGSDILYIRSTIEHAAGTGGGCMVLQPGDDDIAARDCPALAGCSVQAYNTIIFPLKSLRVTLKTIKLALNNWATKAKMMNSQMALIEHIDRDDNRTRTERMARIKGIIYDAIGCIDENYVYSFYTFAEEMHPTIRALWDLQNLLKDICDRLNIDINDKTSKPRTPKRKRSNFWSDHDMLDSINAYGRTMDTSKIPLGPSSAPPPSAPRSPFILPRSMFADEFFGKYTSLYDDSKLNPGYNPALAATALEMDPVLRVYAYANHLSRETTEKAVRIYNLAKGYAELAEQMRKISVKWDTEEE